MTRKVLLIFALAIASIVCAHADTFIVYALTGNVSRVVNKETTALKVRDKVTNKDVISIPAKGSIIILNIKTHEKVTISKPGKATIDDLLKFSTTEKKVVQDTYWAWLLKQIKGNTTVAVGNQVGITEREVPQDSLINVLNNQE